MPSGSHDVKQPGRSRMKWALAGVSGLIVLSSLIAGIQLFQRQQRQMAMSGTATAVMQSRNATADTQNTTATAIVHNQQATATSIAVATATVTDYPLYMPGSGTLALYDPLQKELFWKKFVDVDDHSSCWYGNDGLHVQTAETSYYFVCGEGTVYKNFAFEVQMTILKGDCGGLGLRYDAKKQSSYALFFCQDGTVVLQRNASFQTKDETTLTNIKAAAVVKTGYGQINRIAVLAKQGTFAIYANGELISTVNDASFAQGIVAVLADEGSNNTEVLYRDARVWAV